MKSYPAKFKGFQRKIVQMGASQKLQNSIQILIILWLVYPIHTNSLFQVIFEELPSYHFPPLNTSILGKDSQIQLNFHLNILVFQTNGKNGYSFPVLSRFCNCLWCENTSLVLSQTRELRNLETGDEDIFFSVPSSKSSMVAARTRQRLLLPPFKCLFLSFIRRE